MLGLLDLNYPCVGLLPLQLAECEPQLPGHDVGLAGGAVVPLQVLQVAEEDCVDRRAVHREQHTEQNSAVQRKQNYSFHTSLSSNFPTRSLALASGSSVG